MKVQTKKDLINKVDDLRQELLDLQSKYYLINAQYRLLEIKYDSAIDELNAITEYG